MQISYKAISKLVFFFVGWAISRCLSTSPHPINRARGVVCPQSMEVGVSGEEVAPALKLAVEAIRS